MHGGGSFNAGVPLLGVGRESGLFHAGDLNAGTKPNLAAERCGRWHVERDALSHRTEVEMLMVEGFLRADEATALCVSFCPVATDKEQSKPENT